ncbi:CRISPR-associated protein Cas2 [Kytococcus aerolatus]|uniref:CRISPR-associated protein Cas2 n=1 Tax=Kytococcus aerolatus TaxID=592308 RepID=A0A212U5Y2_9MICO|nr:type I-E CRISPR-associated endoribonuclease Cas2e [Kytococcus aerolatus]SNC73481.1 CRISPR-associated protein Cas2 [Kytococcus aerolatus]
MVVLVLTAVPPGLRGHLTRWLLEISPGVFVGQVSTRVRELMWERVGEYMEVGRALLVYAADTEQGLRFETLGHDWDPVDFEGLTLMRRPVITEEGGGARPHHEGSVTPGPSRPRKRRRRTKFI